MKKLYRSETNKSFAGVIAGLGEYFEVDPILLRLAFVPVTLASGVFPGAAAYLVAMLIVPKKRG